MFSKLISRSRRFTLGKLSIPGCLGKRSKTKIMRPFVFMITTSIAWSLRSKFSLARGHSMLSSIKDSVINESISHSSRTQLVDKFKEHLANNHIDAFIVPTDDPHLSEYTAPYYNRREFISGFTGSAGSAVITKDKSLLFTDGRYHNQASMELDESWTLMKLGLKDVPTVTEYLSTSLPSGSVVGVDPFLHSASEYQKLVSAFAPKDITLKSIESNPIDSIWGEKRPAPPAGTLRVHAIEYAGKSVADKLKDLREQLTAKKCDGIASTSLDEIAWVYNIRGSDVPCNPVAVSYALITLDSAYLFIDAKKVPVEVQAHLTESGVTILPYEHTLPTISDLTQTQGKTLWLDTKRVNHAIYSVTNSTTRYEADSPIILMKACKNDIELNGMKAAHLRDGAAMAEFFHWLETTLSDPTAHLTEVDIDTHVCAFRRSYGMSEPSFDTIAGVGGNGAIIHYRYIACIPIYTYGCAG